MKNIVSAQNIFKKYFRHPYRNAAHSFLDILKIVAGYDIQNELRKDEFYAVNDVSFDLKPGESLGLIGTNGSGKSTLLKIIANIIEPTAGNIERNGSIQSLINLGAGFDRNLSGRDNINVAASLIGFKGNELKNIFDSIVEFSELQDYIDSPVSTYSSGMYARLGYSVAVHLKPQLLLVDEILSVGDSNFQNKCKTHLQNLLSEGTTLILVSHSDTYITQLCKRAIWLKHGKAMEDGDSKTVMNKYHEFLNQNKGSLNVQEIKKSNLYGVIYPKSPTLDQVQCVLTDPKNNPLQEVRSGDPARINYTFSLNTEIVDLNISVNIYRDDGLLITAFSSLNTEVKFDNKTMGTIKGTIDIPNLSLAPGKYILVMPIHSGSSYLHRDIVYEFQVKNRETLHWGVSYINHNYTISNHQ